jgi:NADP-dependent 3-hydroxy acid dehydrogenase YdfG
MLFNRQAPNLYDASNHPVGSNLKGVKREKREVKTTGVQPRYVEGTEISNESCAVSVSFSCAAAAA